MIDFKISETPSFRLGVPVRAELKGRDGADTNVPPVTKLGNLQWTVPVANTTGDQVVRGGIE